MTHPEIIYEHVDEKELILNANEVAARLNVARGYTSDLIDKCEKMLRSELDCRFSAVKTAVLFPSEDKIDLGFGEFESHSLYRNLSGCREAFIFAVTVGHGVDRLLKRLAVTSVAEHFIADGLASAFAEAACDYADAKIKGGLKCRPRFSPGYGDLPLSIQPDILLSVDAGKLLNITLGKTLLMSPMKSITAIMGIENEGYTDSN